MEKKRVTICLEQGGMRLEAGTGFEDFKVYALEGMTGLDFDFVTETAPQSPNTRIRQKRPLPRQIELMIYCNGEHRAFLNRFFNPFAQGRLTAEWDGIKRWISYYPKPVSIIQPTVYRQLSVQVTLICAEPYWRDMDDYGKDIAARQPLMAFPFVMGRRGLISEYRILNIDVPIQNGGDVAVGARIVFQARGDMKNPSMTLNGKEYVRAVLDMVRGDVLEFSTDIDDLHVLLNGADVLHRTDIGMSFFQIPMGENMIRYAADEGTHNLRVTVYFTPLYLGL